MKMGCDKFFFGKQGPVQDCVTGFFITMIHKCNLTTKGSFMGIASLETTTSENDLKLFDKGSIKHCVSINIVVVIFWKCLMD